MLGLNGVKTVLDFCIGILFFYQLFFKLIGSFIRLLILVSQKKTLML